MLLKKIYSNGLERVIFIDVECHNELNDLITKTLVIELMGKHSNVILLANNVVIDSLRHLNKFDNSARDIFPGSKYIQIEPSKPEFSTIKTFDDFYKLFAMNGSISTTLSNSVNGFGKIIFCIY